MRRSGLPSGRPAELGVLVFPWAHPRANRTGRVAPRATESTGSTRRRPPGEGRPPSATPAALDGRRALVKGRRLFPLESEGGSLRSGEFCRHQFSHFPSAPAFVAGSRTLAVAARASVTPRESPGIQHASFSLLNEMFPVRPLCRGSTVAHARHRAAGRFCVVSPASKPWSCLGGAVHPRSALAGFRPRVWHSPSGKAPVLV